jgi:hypothetical protein
MIGGVKLWSLNTIQDTSGPTLRTVRKGSQNETYSGKDSFILKMYLEFDLATKRLLTYSGYYSVEISKNKSKEKH